MSDYTILLIDYEPRSIETTCRALEKAGYHVNVAKDGFSGIELFHSLKPDLTLIEAMLPKKHGFEVCQELKNTAHGKQSAVVIITSVYRGRRYRIQAKHHYKCDGYLEKPVSDELLVNTVQELLGVTAKDGAERVSATSEPSDAPADSVSESEVPPAEQKITDPNNIVSIESARPRMESEAPRMSPSTAAIPGVARGGGAQPAVARMASPGVDPSSEPGVEPAKPETVRSPELLEKRGRAPLWIALALLAALAGLFLVIILV